MKSLAVLAVAVAVGTVFACSDDDGGSPAASAGSSSGGQGGTAGSGGAGSGGVAGNAGRAGTGGRGGAGGNPVPPSPALGPDADTVGCPTLITGSLEASDATQTGRHSRITPVSACGMTKPSPGNAADPTNPHYYDVYRFSNPTAA